MNPTHDSDLEATGRFVVVFDTDDTEILDDLAPSLLQTDGFSTEGYYPRLGIAVVDADDADFESLSVRCGQRRVPVTVFPEAIYHALDEPVEFDDTPEATWGLQAVRALESANTGAGIRLAVLDTGFHAAHPDFAGRSIITASFVSGEGPEDTHGHGTHCIGTAAGPRARERGRGYGVAPGVEIYSGKVLGANGSGTDTTILAGIDWALQNDCQVISMSLGADIRQVHPPYVAAGRRALARGSLLIAAAGNNARRSAGDPGFVGAPANSPYVMAVGAVDRKMRVADFSSRALTIDGGEVDIAAPGVDIESSWIAPQLYRTISGTSMATPHVAGIAALIAEATGARGQQLWDRLVAAATDLGLPREDVGAGLAVVPNSETAGVAAPLSEPAEQRWVITVDDQRVDDLAVVAAELRSAGVTITQTLPTIGMLYGTSKALSREDLIGITGVASADTNHQHRINPPEAEVQ